MPFRPYQEKIFKLTGVSLDRVHVFLGIKSSDTTHIPSRMKALRDTFIHTECVQVFANQDGTLAARKLFPTLFTSSIVGNNDIYYVSPENYKGDNKPPESGDEITGEELEKLKDILYAHHSFYSPILFDGKLASLNIPFIINLPEDLDPSMHIISDRHEMCDADFKLPPNDNGAHLSP